MRLRVDLDFHFSGNCPKPRMTDPGSPNLSAIVVSSIDNYRLIVATYTCWFSTDERAEGRLPDTLTVAQPPPNNWFAIRRLCQAETVSSEPESDEAQGGVFGARSLVHSDYVNGC